MILLDSNILVYAHTAQSPFFEAARRVREQAIQGEIDVCLTPQVLCEFLAACTNAKIIRPALTPAQATRELLIYWTHPQLRKIFPRDHTVERFAKYVEQYHLDGQRIYDAFLVATMLDNDVHTLYTLNTKDFERYPEVRVVNPFSHRVVPS